MNRNIAIIGSGQLGSRHLQALAAVGKDNSIYITDPSEESLKIALQRYYEVSNDSSPQVVTCTSIHQLPQQLYMVVVATGSTVRRKVIEQLLGHAKVDFLVLEKFLFPSLEDYDTIGQLLNDHAVKTYVNTPRRMFPYFQKMKEKLKTPFDMQLSGTGWGLACNVVHYMDIMSFLAGDNGIAKIDFISDGKLYDSKRPGYAEFCGTIRMVDHHGNTGTFTCYADGDRPLLLSISDMGRNYVIKETDKASISELSVENGELSMAKKDVTAPRQSQLTHLLLEDFIHKGACILPEYNLSASLHKQVLSCFLKEYRYLKNDQSLTSCPIT
jgi:predicted dehydrogenase